MPEKELFNLMEDPEEQHNLINEKKEIADELELKLTRWTEKKLGNRPDPLRVQSRKGLPAKLWLERVLAEDNLTYEEWVEKQRYV